MVKRELVVHFDIGLIGTFVKWKEVPNEDDFVYLVYVPLNSWWPKRYTYEKPIPKTAIHPVDPMLKVKGIQDRLIYIYTGEDGSIAVQILETNYNRIIGELRDKVKSLEMKNAALMQEVEDARSGTSKAIDSAKKILKSERDVSNPGINIFDRLNSNRMFGGDDDFS